MQTNELTRAIDEPIDAYPVHLWTSAVHKVGVATTMPVAGTIISELVGPSWLTWLFFTLSLLGMAACVAALAREYRADQR
ncbi:hypothetical protein ACN27G_27530 [Plantactinospora sp. WMMB334]|uniref:hypothetical protein n=1 Tax=Plantactinospora sp. WMMB334 TaxID=3404119 RepID=UPI003B959774